jgi:ATP-dependent protease ClpP protease subunit
MIASLSKPTVSLVLGGSHSIGVPLAVSAQYSFIVPTATMIIHPVRMNGTVIGVSQTYDYFEKIQDRILNFVSTHSKIEKEDLKQLMHNTSQLAKDVGSILIGPETVDKGIIDEVGGIKEALKKLYEMSGRGDEI